MNGKIDDPAEKTPFVGTLLLAPTDISGMTGHAFPIFLAARPPEGKWLVAACGIRAHARERLQAFSDRASPLLIPLPGSLRRLLPERLFDRLLWERALLPVLRKNGVQLLVARLPAFVPPTGGITVIDPGFDSPALGADAAPGGFRGILLRGDGFIEPMVESVRRISALPAPRLVILPRGSRPSDLEEIFRNAGMEDVRVVEMTRPTEIESEVTWAAEPFDAVEATGGRFYSPIPRDIAGLWDYVQAVELGRRVDALIHGL